MTHQIQNLPYNPHDPDPWLRPSIMAAIKSDIARRYRMQARNLRAVRRYAEADRLDLLIAELETAAEAMQAEIEAAKYDTWLFSHRRAA